MKKTIPIALAIIVSGHVACKKTTHSPDNSTSQSAVETNSDNYSSINDFYSKNGVALQTFTFKASENTSYVSAQGTTINIPANTFTPSNAAITIEFKDIYTKSDMVLSNMPTNLIDGSPLISGGQFYIRALNGNTTATASVGKNITISQPFKQTFDKLMSPYAYTTIKDSTTGSSYSYWSSYQQNNYHLLNSATAYIHSIYANPFIPTWYNTDHPYYVPLTSMTLTPNQASPYLNVYLLIKNNNSSAKAWLTGDNNFICSMPSGQECVMVAIGVKDAKLYSCFKALTVTTNQKMFFDLSETTTDKFKEALKALD